MKVLEEISELYHLKNLVDEVANVSDSELKIWLKEYVVYEDTDVFKFIETLENFKKRLETVSKKVFMNEYWSKKREGSLNMKESKDQRI